MQAFAIITETWFHKGVEMDELKARLKNSYGLQSFDCMRRKSGANNPGGGVSIIYDPRKIRLKEFSLKRKGHEIIGAVGKIPNNTRKIYILGTYISPRLKAEKFHECLGLLNDTILKIKTESPNPYIVVGGDMNKRDLGEAIDDYADMEIITTAATRSAATLDICATNFNSELVEATNHLPLESEVGASDHRYLTYRFAMKHKHEFHWKYIKVRKITEEKEAAFMREVGNISWEDALPSTFDEDKTTETLHKILYEVSERHFPTKWTKVRSTDDP